MSCTSRPLHNRAHTQKQQAHNEIVFLAETTDERPTENERELLTVFLWARGAAVGSSVLVSLDEKDPSSAGKSAAPRCCICKDSKRAIFSTFALPDVMFGKFTFKIHVPLGSKLKALCGCLFYVCQHMTDCAESWSALTLLYHLNGRIL